MRKVSYLLLSSFALVVAVSLWVGWNFVSQEVSIVEDSAEVLNAGYFFLYIIGATVALILVLKFYQGRSLFRWLELLLVFSSVQVFLFLFLDELLSLAGALALTAVRWLQPKLKTPFLMFATAIVGALLGSSLDILPAMVLAWMLAAYDYYAVFKSKHMVFLAKQLGKRQAAFAIELKHGKENVLLGTGDLVMPGMLAVSALKISLGSALAVYAGSVIGLAILIWFMEKHKGYYPALPPIVGGATILLLAKMLVSAF